MRRTFIPLAIVGMLLLFLFSGCRDALRFAPSEPQKQTAELTHALARKVTAEGTDAQSPAARRLESGTRAALAYIGRPAEPADPEQFDTIAAAAEQDAARRPDPWEAADSVLDLGIAICGIVGGAGSIKLAAYLAEMRAKSKALQEVVKNNDLFKDQAQKEGDQKAVAAFKDAQSSQSPTTKTIVAKVRAST